MLLIGKPSISMGHLHHGELLNNQRVYQKKKIGHGNTKTARGQFRIAGGLMFIPQNYYHVILWMEEIMHQFIGALSHYL